MDSSKSLVRTNPKPINVFYVWYTELCRRINCTPAPVVKPAKPKYQTVLDFVGDRLRVEEWHPIIAALRSDTSLHVINIKSRLGNCQFLHDVDTEEKAKNMKRRFGSLWTAFVLRQLLKSLSTSLRNSQVLTCLELDGLPMFSEYLEPLLQALKKNKTLKNLSLANCIIADVGCQLVCAYLRFTPNIEVINLSGCGLSSPSGQHLSKLIKYQQINRYCESWHNSLRYENPEAGVMRGVKRITMNKIFDLRQNELLEVSTLERILQILRDRVEFGPQPEFQWCNTALSLSWNSVHDCPSKFSIASNLHKTKSAPMKKLSKESSSTCDQWLKKSKTVENVLHVETTKHKYDATDRRLQALNTKLRVEIQKRKEIEKRNEELEHKLEEIKSASKIQVQNVPELQIKTTASSTKKVSGRHSLKKPKEDKAKLHVAQYEKKWFSEKPTKRVEDEAESQDLANYFLQDPGSSKTYKCEEANVPNNTTASQVSLIKYMEELKHGATVADDGINDKAYCTSKYFIKGNDT
ncbi:hypothetical protein NQ317_005682 [Molorchus minor]|uniref:Centrosomal protein of 78 kDa n=1 Tax=Molorchus minor TaxID=1323400 RepID=A0ABQ9J858_9CUCU|nr:hypothetical protein NQ317_005682 [Molorchus minor]